jgi:hypothetical protein
MDYPCEGSEGAKRSALGKDGSREWHARRGGGLLGEQEGKESQYLDWVATNHGSLKWQQYPRRGASTCNALAPCCDLCTLSLMRAFATMTATLTSIYRLSQTRMRCGRCPSYTHARTRFSPTRDGFRDQSRPLLPFPSLPHSPWLEDAGQIQAAYQSQTSTRGRLASQSQRPMTLHGRW